MFKELFPHFPNFEIRQNFETKWWSKMVPNIIILIGPIILGSMILYPSLEHDTNELAYHTAHMLFIAAMTGLFLNIYEHRQIPIRNPKSDSILNVIQIAIFLCFPIFLYFSFRMHPQDTHETISTNQEQLGLLSAIALTPFAIAPVCISLFIDSEIEIQNHELNSRFLEELKGLKGESLNNEVDITSSN